MSARAAVRIALLLLTLAATCTLVCACGGSGGDHPLSKRAYIERFNGLQADAADEFAELNSVARSPKTAKQHLRAFDDLIAGVEVLDPPADWTDEHATMLESLRTMRASLEVLSRASARNTAAINAQVKRYAAAQADFERAVQHVNSSR